MAFKFANSVRETSTTTGTGTLNLAGAVSGYATFVAGIGSTNTCPYTIEGSDGSYEHGIGTVTDATPDTLARTTILSSSNSGNAIDLPAGTHTVYCAWLAERAQQVNLEHVAGTDADTSMAVGQMYVVDMSAWATADRTYTLPATALVGDRCGIMVSAGDASHELIVTAASGDTLNGISGGTEWSRVFITGEVLIFRCIAASATWIVERDGRIGQSCVMRLSTAATAESLDTWTSPTAKSGVWTADINVGSIASTSDDRIIVRRAGNYFCAVAGATNTAATTGDIFNVTLYKNGTAAGGGTACMAATINTPASSSYPKPTKSNLIPLAAGDYLVFQYYWGGHANGLAAFAAPGYYNVLSIVEQF